MGLVTIAIAADRVVESSLIFRSQRLIALWLIMTSRHVMMHHDHACTTMYSHECCRSAAFCPECSINCFSLRFRSQICPTLAGPHLSGGELFKYGVPPHGGSCLNPAGAYCTSAHASAGPCKTCHQARVTLSQLMHTLIIIISL